MTDDETGIDPVSKDGEGATDDELAKRRKNGGGSMADRSAAEQAKLDAEDGKGTEANVGEDADGQMFVWEQGRKVTLGTVIARGTKVTHHFVFGGKRTKGSGGLMGFDAKPLMIVSGRPGNVVLVPSYNDDGTLSEVAIENHVKAMVVAPADSESGIAMIEHVLDEMGFVRKKKPAAAAV